MMETWIWFCESGLALLALTILCKTTVNSLLIRSTFYLAKTSVRPGKMILGAVIISLLEVAPIYFTVGFHTRMISDGLIYCLALFPFPAVTLIYYLMYRYLFRAPLGMIPMAIDWVLMGQYLMLLIYALFNCLFVGVFGEALYWRSLFIPDYYALPCVALFGVLLYLALHSVVDRTKTFMVLPFNYVPEHMARRIAYILVSSTTTYLMLVSMRLVFFGDYQNHLVFSSFTIVVHIILVSLQMFTMVDKYHKNRRIVIEWQAKQTELYIQSLLRSTAEFRRVKHDFYNILQTYGGYIALHDFDGLHRYHSSLTNATVEAGAGIDMIDALRDRAPLYTLLDIKKSTAEQSEVKLQIDSVNALAKVAMSDFDLCRVLSNLLDKAVQAAAESEEKEVTLKATLRDREVIVEISNPASAAMESDKLFEDGYTTKEAHSGLGLGSIKSILDHNRGSSIEMRYADNRMTAVLVLEAV